MIKVKDAGRLKELILKEGYSLCGFSKRISVSHSTLYAVLERRTVSAPVSRKITGALEMPFDEIFLIQ